MKKIIQISILLITVLVSTPKENIAQVKAGIGAAFGSEIEQVGIQADLHYRFTEKRNFQVGGGFVYYVPENNLNFYEVNLNGAYIFYDKYMFKSYLYTGLNFAQSKIKSEGFSVSESAIGLNIGAGAEYDFNSILAFGDLKYVIGELDQPVFSIGLRIPF